MARITEQCSRESEATLGNFQAHLEALTSLERQHAEALEAGLQSGLGRQEQARQTVQEARATGLAAFAGHLGELEAMEQRQAMGVQARLDGVAAWSGAWRRSKGRASRARRRRRRVTRSIWRPWKG